MSSGFWTKTIGGHPMVRLTVRLSATKRRTVWAGKLGLSKKGSLLQWIVLTKDGQEERAGKKSNEVIREIIVASQADVVSERPARLNLRYEEMEVMP